MKSGPTLTAGTVVETAAITNKVTHLSSLELDTIILVVKVKDESLKSLELETIIQNIIISKASNLKGNRTSFWKLAGWDQFPYKSWVNLQQPHPYFHEGHHNQYPLLHQLIVDELEAGKCRRGDCGINFSDLDEVFFYSGPLVIKTTLDVLPANGKIHYFL